MLCDPCGSGSIRVCDPQTGRVAPADPKYNIWSLCPGLIPQTLRTQAWERDTICKVQGANGYMGSLVKSSSSRYNPKQAACSWSTCQKQTPWRRHGGPTSSSGTFAHSPALCSSIGVLQRTPDLAGPSLGLSSLHRWEQVHIVHMWKSLEKLWWTICCL